MNLSPLNGAAFDTGPPGRTLPTVAAANVVPKNPDPSAAVVKPLSPDPSAAKVTPR